MWERGGGVRTSKSREFFHTTPLFFVWEEGSNLAPFPPPNGPARSGCRIIRSVLGRALVFFSSARKSHPSSR